MARDYTQPFNVILKDRTSQWLGEDICTVLGRLHITILHIDLSQCDRFASIVELNNDVLAESRIYRVSQILDTALIVNKDFDSPWSTPYLL